MNSNATMTRIAVKDLTGAALDWAVAKAEGLEDVRAYGPAQLTIKGPRIWIGGKRPFDPSTNWSDGGPIIEREAISVIRSDDEWGKDEKGFCNNGRIPVWCAESGQQSYTESTNHDQHDPMYQFYTDSMIYGPTPLIAAMRCYVASKLGDEIEIPLELLN